MQDLLDAIEVRRRYNQMDFDKFIKQYEEFFNIKVPEKLKESYKFTGLNNVDFITMDITEIEIS